MSPAEVHQHGLVPDDGVGHHQFHVLALAGGHLRFQRAHEAALQVPAFVDLLGAVFVRPEFGDAVCREHRVAEEMVVMGVGVDDDERQLGLLPHRVQDLPPLPRPAAGIDHHGPLGSHNQSGIQQRTFGDQHIVVRADFEPF